jgi:hypothetical protein
MHARLADVLRSLAAFARVASRSPGDVDARRQLISQEVTDVQGFIESSKFEAGAAAADAQTVERLTADAQTVFLVLLAIARHGAAVAGPPDVMRAAMSRVDHDVAVILDGIADRIRRGAASVIDVDGRGSALEQSVGTDADAPRVAVPAGSPPLYRELAAAVNRLADDSRSVDAVRLSPVPR